MGLELWAWTILQSKIGLGMSYCWSRMTLLVFLTMFKRKCKSFGVIDEVDFSRQRRNQLLIIISLYFLVLSATNISKREWRHIFPSKIRAEGLLTDKLAKLFEKLEVQLHTTRSDITTVYILYLSIYFILFAFLSACIKNPDFGLYDIVSRLF